MTLLIEFFFCKVDASHYVLDWARNQGWSVLDFNVNAKPVFGLTKEKVDLNVFCHLSYV